MPTTGNLLLVERLVTMSLFKLVRLIFVTVQRVYWQLNGTARQLLEARLPHNYKRSAQVLDVLLRHKFCSTQPATCRNFICTHNRFEDPQYIIDNDNITLMTITEQDEAVFCEAKDKDMHLWRGEYDPFIYEAHFKYCHRMIIVPMSTFHQLAEKIGDPVGQVIFLPNTTRCGSTLLTQALENTGRCVAVSEPASPDAVGHRYRKSGDSPELRQLARDVIRWECRPYSTMQPLAYFIKINGPNALAVPFLKEVYPASRCLFMYRDVIAVAKSRYRMSMVQPAYRLVFLLGRLSGQLTKMIFNAMGYDGSDFCVRIDNDLATGVLVLAVSTAPYLEMRRRGFDVSALRYEDLVDRPLEMCRVVLEFCNLPASLAEQAVLAFDIDSQRSSIIGQSTIGHLKNPQMTPRKKAKLNELLKQYNMPVIAEPYIIDGTLTC